MTIRCLALGLTALSTLRAQEAPRSYASTFWQDTKDYTTAPLRYDSQDYLTGALWIGGLFVGAQLDKSIGEGISKHPSSTMDSIGKTVEPFGQYGAYVVLAGFAAEGIWGEDPRALRTSQQGLEASVLTLITVGVLKHTVDRPRPNTAGFGEGLHFSLSNVSFPSGHSAQAFTVATVISENYGDDHAWVPWLSYGTASLVGLQRVYTKEHNPTDVVAGAAIGYFTAKWVMHRHNKDNLHSQTNWDFQPVVLHNGLEFDAAYTY